MDAYRAYNMSSHMQLKYYMYIYIFIWKHRYNKQDIEQ